MSPGEEPGESRAEVTKPAIFSRPNPGLKTGDLKLLIGSGDPRPGLGYGTAWRDTGVDQEQAPAMVKTVSSTGEV